MVEALRQLKADEADFVVFEDVREPDNYVQVTDFIAGVPTVVEVTKRDYPNQTLPKLTEEQVKALGNLGLSREAKPNHRGEFDWKDPLCVAKLCEAAFKILGSDPSFDLAVGRMGLWTNQGDP